MFVPSHLVFAGPGLCLRHILTPLVCSLSLKDVSPICSYRFPRVETVAYPDVSSRERRDSDDGCRDWHSAYLLVLRPSPYRSSFAHIAYLDRLDATCCRIRRHHTGTWIVGRG